MKRKNLQNLLYAGILSLTIGNASAQWNLAAPSGTPGFNVFCLRTMGTDLYAGGSGIATWNGTTWTNLGRVAPTSTIAPGSLGVNAMTVFNGNLYAAGDIDSMGGVYIDHTIGVAKWNGTAWEKVGTGAPDLGGVTSLAVYHNELYASGNNGINKWDGTTWTSVGTVNNNANVVICVYHDELYAASSFSHVGAVNMTVGQGFAKWNGTTWTALPGFFYSYPGLPGINVAKASAMIVFKDELFVIGSLDTAGSTRVRGVGRWNGTTWNPTNGGITGNGTLVSNCMSIDSNNLYVVGAIQKVNTTDDSVYLSAYWNGTKWNHMFGGNAPYNSFFATENYMGKIYSSYNSLVRWDGSTTQTTTVQQSKVNIYPNPSTGIFHVSLMQNEPVQISVKNMLGAIICNQQIMHPAADQVIDLSNMPNGMYFIELSGPGSTQIKKVFIER